MTYFHRSFTTRKKEIGKKGGQKNKKKLIQFVNNTLMLANWVQIEMGKTLKTIQVDHNNFNIFSYKVFSFFMQLKHVQRFTFNFNNVLLII